MKSIHVLLICLFLLKMNFSMGQDSETDSLKKIAATSVVDSSRVDALVAVSRNLYNSAPEEAYQYAQKAYELAVNTRYLPGEAQALKFMGLSQYKQGRLLDALGNYNAAMKVFDTLGDRLGVANILSNIGAMYYDQGIEAKSLEYLLKSLKISEEEGDKLRIATALINIGSVYLNKPATSGKALENFYRALGLLEQIDNKPAYSTVLVNIGEVYAQKGQTDSALYYLNKSLTDAEDDETICFSLIMMAEIYKKQEDYVQAVAYHQKAYDIAQSSGKKLEMTKALVGLGDTYFVQQKIRNALEYFSRAESLAKEINSNYDLKDIYEGISKSYAATGDFEEAFIYLGLLNGVKDSIYNIQTDRKISNLQLDFEIQKQEGQISLLKKDKELQAAELSREKFAKNSAITGLAMLLIIAFILFKGYKEKLRTNRILDKQKDEIEKLLLNILPAEVARELQSTGVATPRYYERVSVLFTDFKSFSKLADRLSPQEVIEELSMYFMAFDEIIEKYGLEKIKTIGDAYMCAGGIPVEDPDHPVKIVRASLEIQEYIRVKNVERSANGKPEWDLRIGIHSGPVVAGVVGKKKYAYDVWGSTVNIANRMESNGEPGQVNISSSTYELVKDKFICMYRGKINAKNLGDIDMYFVKEEIVLMDDPHSIIRNGKWEMGNEKENSKLETQNSKSIYTKN